MITFWLVLTIFGTCVALDMTVRGRAGNLWFNVLIGLGAIAWMRIVLSLLRA